MGSKDRTFAAKMNKGGSKFKTSCNECGESYSYIKHVSTKKSEKGAYKFNENFVAVCKCNQNTVYA